MRGGYGAMEGELTSGFRYPGAVIALLACYPLLRQVLPKDPPLARFADAVSPGIAFCLATLRIDCLLRGCCSGSVCSLPWAIRFPAGSPAWRQHIAEGLVATEAAQSLAVHPLQLYFLLASLATAIFCLIFACNEYAFALLLTSGSAQSAPPFIPIIIGEGGFDWPAVAAGTTLFLLPIVIFTIFLRNQLLRGITFGAVRR